MAKGISTALTARRAAAIAIAGAAATALSACGAGMDTQTDEKQSAIAGVNIDQGDLALRDLQVEFDSSEGYAAGDDAALRVWIDNEGEDEVSLTGVAVYSSADDAEEGADQVGTVTYVDPTAPADEPSESPSEEASPSDGESSSEDAEESPSDGASATGEESPSPEEPEFEGDTVIDVPIAPAGYVRLDENVEDGPYLLIEDLAVDLPVGESIWVVFTFSDGTEAATALPIGQDTTGDESRSYFEAEEAEEH